MGSQRDAFGFLPPLPGEHMSGQCCVSRCRRPATATRATVTTAYAICVEHAEDWDAGRLAGSIASGGFRVIGEEQTP